MIDGRALDVDRQVLVRFQDDGVYEVVDECFGANGLFIASDDRIRTRYFIRGSSCSPQSAAVSFALQGDPRLQAAKEGSVSLVRTRKLLDSFQPDATRLTLGPALLEDRGAYQRADLSMLEQLGADSRPVLVWFKRYPQATVLWSMSLQKASTGYDMLLENRSPARIVATLLPQTAGLLSVMRVEGQLLKDGAIDRSTDPRFAFEDVDDPDRLAYRIQASLGPFPAETNQAGQLVLGRTSNGELVLDNSDLRITVRNPTAPA